MVNFFQQFLKTEKRVQKFSSKIKEIIIHEFPTGKAISLEYYKTISTRLAIRAIHKTEKNGYTNSIEFRNNNGGTLVFFSSQPAIYAKSFEKGMERVN